MSADHDRDERRAGPIVAAGTGLLLLACCALPLLLCCGLPLIAAGGALAGVGGLLGAVAGEEEEGGEPGVLRHRGERMRHLARVFIDRAALKRRVSEGFAANSIRDVGKGTIDE